MYNTSLKKISYNPFYIALRLFKFVAKAKDDPDYYHTKKHYFPCVIVTFSLQHSTNLNSPGKGEPPPKSYLVHTGLCHLLFANDVGLPTEGNAIPGLVDMSC